MFALPAARVRAGIHHSVRFTLPALGVLCLPGAAHAGDAQATAVLKKMQALYQTAKTYKGTTRGTQSGKGPDGKVSSLTTTQEIRYKSPNRFLIKLSFSGGTGQAAQVNGTTQTVACDGKTIYQYSSKLNQYRKQPAPPTIQRPGPLSINFDSIVADAKMLPSTSVGGRPAFVIQAERPMPPNVPPDKAAQIKPLLKFNILVDKSTYYLLRICGPKGENATDFTDQAINAALPDSAFAFVPPAGAKLFVPPATPAPGAPGAPTSPGIPPKR